MNDKVCEALGWYWTGYRRHRPVAVDTTPSGSLPPKKHDPAKRALKAVEHKQLQAKDRR